MRIGLVAIGARVVRNGSLEISAQVAGDTRNIEMFSEKWKVRLGVIKRLGKARFLPRSCRVAGIASLLERSFVRVSMAIRTACEGYAREPLLPIGACRVTTLTQHIPVLARERIPRAGVVEILTIDPRRFPIDGRVATSTVGAKAALVLVLVTIDTARRQSHPSAIQVFGFKQHPRLQ